MRVLCLGGFLTFGLAFVTFGLGGLVTFAFLAGLVFFFFGGGERSMVYWKVWLSPRPVGPTHVLDSGL